MPDNRVRYGVTEDGEVLWTDEDGCIWMATSALRFEQREQHGRKLRILQQLFICDGAEPMWRDVPATEAF